MAPKSQELVPGTLEMLVLRTVSLGRMHGYGIAQHIERTSADVIRVEKGSLYPALERLLRAGHVTAKWDISPTGRRARYYTITASGRRCLGAEVSSFESMVAAISRVLKTTWGPPPNVISRRTAPSNPHRPPERRRRSGARRRVRGPS